MKTKILKTFKYLASLTFVLAFLLMFGFSQQAKALVIQQTDSSVQSNPISAVAVKIQKLGTGFTGTVTSYSVYFATNPTGLGGTRPSMQIRCYDDSAYTVFNSSCSSIDTQFGLLQTTTKTLYTSTDGVTFNPAKYYAIGVRCWNNCAGEPPSGTNAVLRTYGSSSSLYSGGDFASGYGIVDLYFTMTINGALPPNMTIDNPATGSYLSTSATTTVSGLCLTPGSNQLELTTTPFLARLDPASNYNITCNSDYTYSTSFKPLVGSNSIWIVDKSAIGENPPNIFNNQRYASTQYTGYTGSPYGLSWLLTLEYPPDNGSHNFTINPNTTQQFRFRFKVPDDSVKPQGRIKTILWTSSSRTTASTTNEFIGLDSLDLDGDGLLGLNLGPVPDGQTWYYTEYLENGTTTMYSIPFSVTASSAAQSAGTTVNPNAPDDRQYGPCLNLPLIGLNNFCFGTMFYALFVPNPRFYKDDVNDTYSLMQTKIPFAFYYQLKDQLSGVTATSTDFTYNIPVNLASSTGVSLTIPFSSNNSGVHSVRAALDPWFKAFAWFFFAWWAYKKAITFHF